jgi:hypothetical protein
MTKSKRTFLKLLLKGPQGMDKSLTQIRNILELREWEDLAIEWDEQAKGFVISTQFDGSKVDLIAKHFQEELFESACAVLESVEGMRVEIIDAHLLT